MGGQFYTYDLSLIITSLQIADFDKEVASFASRENLKVYLRMARFLIEHGADVNEPNYDGR